MERHPGFIKIYLLTLLLLEASSMSLDEETTPCKGDDLFDCFSHFKAVEAPRDVNTHPNNHREDRSLDGFDESSASTRIMGGPDIYVHRGSMVNMTCVVSHGLVAPSYIFWYHGLMAIESAVGSYRTISMWSPRNSNSTISRLHFRAKTSDSGEYHCKPSTVAGASVSLHVLDGEKYEVTYSAAGNSLLTTTKEKIVFPLVLVLNFLVDSVFRNF